MALKQYGPFQLKLSKKMKSRKGVEKCHDIKNGDGNNLKKRATIYI